MTFQLTVSAILCTDVNVGRLIGRLIDKTRSNATDENSKINQFIKKTSSPLNIAPNNPRLLYAIETFHSW
jgi:hypothetical protein